MLVIDASAAADLLLNTARAERVRSAIGVHGLHAPHLLSIEFTSVLRTVTRRGELGAAGALRALTELDELGIEWYEHLPLLPRCLARGESVSANDALYLALAEALAAPLLTCDVELARANGHVAEIVLIEH